jgi:diacylglycerol kinase (ATP)
MPDYNIIKQIGLIIGLKNLLLKVKMMKTNYVDIIINPAAGNRKALRLAQTLLQKIKSRSDFEIHISVTKEKDEATFITRRAILEGALMIIALGGDGTINEVVNGFFSQGKPINYECELGIINCGTGGGLARALNLPRRADQQIEQLLSPVNRALDLGQISYKESSGMMQKRLFVNECQVGIGCKVASVAGKKSKIFGERIAFGFSAALVALSMKPLKLSIAFDNDPMQNVDLMGLVIGNGAECAGGMKLTPDAKLSDGFFDVLTIKNMNVIDRMLNLSKVYSGKHILSPYFSVKRCKKLQIRSDNNVFLEGDGEILGKSPFDIEIFPSAIKVKCLTAN